MRRSDAALVRRFRAGDESAFAVLHARYAEAITNYAAYMLRGTPHDPDDAAQDVFLRAYQALRRDDREVEIRPWLYRVAHNRCIDALRRPATGALDEGAHAGGPLRGGGDPAAAIEQRETMRALLRDIGTLTDAQRSALLLRELGGLSHQAVAEALGITATSSRMLVHRARMALVDAAEARDTSCREVRERLVAAADAGARPARRDRRHVAGCAGCRAFQRAQAGVERELSLLAPLGLAHALGGGGAAAAATATGGWSLLGGGGGAKLAVGACCALLAGGGAAVGVTEVTSRHEQHHARAGAARPPAAAQAIRPAPRAAPVTVARTTTRRAAAAPAKKRAATHATPPPAATRTTTPAQPMPGRTIDLADLDRDTPATRPRHDPPAETIDLADLSG